MQLTTRFLVQGPQYQAQNVTTTNPAASYAFYAYTDLALGDGLLPVNGTCNSNSNNTQYTAALNSCGNANSGCCMDMSSYTVSVPLHRNKVLSAFPLASLSAFLLTFLSAPSSATTSVLQKKSVYCSMRCKV